MNKVSMAEQSAIGCIILDPQKVMPEAIDVLKADDFQHPLHKQIFDIASELYTMGKTIDIVTVLHKLGNQPEHREYLVNCVEVTPSTAGFMAYFDAVKENSRRQKALEKTAQLMTALTEGDNLTDCQSLAVEASEALNDAQHDESFTAKQGFIDFYTSKMKPRSYIKTGIEKLDKYTYIDKGDYVIIGGRPSSGKTALTLQIAVNMAKTYNVVYFSLETSKQKVFDRLVSSYTMTSMEEIKRQQINDWSRIAQAADSFGQLKLTVVQAAGWTVPQIAAKAVQLGAEVIFIDYLSLIHDRLQSIYERVSNISIGLHTMAQQRKICVVALSQLSRAGDGSPELTSLRESGQLEQDADVVILLNGKDAENRTLKIAKNKEGITGSILLDFDGEHQKFTEIVGE